MKAIVKILCVALLFSGWQTFAQEEHQNNNEKDHDDEHFHKHSIAILLNHTFIGTGLDDEGGSKTISVPSWAINYDYHFDHRWSLGLHNDIILEKFIVENKVEGEEILERETPIAVVAVGSYRPIVGLALELGTGIEFDKNENFGLLRLGAEYGIEIPQLKMEAIFGIDYDILFDGYDALNIGIGLAKFF